MDLTVFTNGASRGNPGHAAYGFIISDNHGKVLYQKGCYIGIATNNVAEYRAVLNALGYISENISNVSSVNFFADSRLVVEQLSGRFRIKNVNLKLLIDQIRQAEGKIGKVSYTHIYREKNKLADALANKALDLHDSQ